MEKTARQITEERRAKERDAREQERLARMEQAKTLTIQFDKISYRNEKIKNNKVKVFLNLEFIDKEFVNYETLETVQGAYILSIHGEIYNQGGSKVILNGQIQEELYKYLYNNRHFKILYNIWNKYNNNDKIEGTKEQEDCLNYIDLSSGGGGYSDLKSKHYTLNCFDLVEHKGHEYGSKMLYKPINKYDLLLIKSFYTSHCGSKTYNSLVYGTK